MFRLSRFRSSRVRSLKADSTSSDLTYPEVGATDGALPPGYHHVREHRHIGRGRTTFEAACATLMSWEMHERAGVHQVSGPPEAADGDVVAFRWLWMWFECRVISVVAEADRRGFTYGTLARHPECGEEQFLVEYDEAAELVTARITAFSKPANRLIWAVGPLARRVQAHMTQRYLEALG